MRLRTALWVCAFLGAATSVYGSVSVAPPSPSQTDVVTIRVENAFGAEAHVTSAAITRTGNTFLIRQDVEIACTLPSNPLVVSQFTVGPLAPGEYGVNATVTFTGIGPPPACAPTPLTQTTSFAVAPSSAIPALGSGAVALLAVGFAGVALVVLRS